MAEVGRLYCWAGVRPASAVCAWRRVGGHGRCLPVCVHVCVCACVCVCMCACAHVRQVATPPPIDCTHTVVLECMCTPAVRVNGEASWHIVLTLVLVTRCNLHVLSSSQGVRHAQTPCCTTRPRGRAHYGRAARGRCHRRLDFRQTASHLFGWPAG